MDSEKIENNLIAQDHEELVTFNREVLIFFDHLEEVMKLKRNSFAVNENKDVRKGLRNYILVYNKTFPVEHVDYFYDIYTDNRNSIVGFTGDNWLKEGKIKVEWGEQIKVRISLSEIYCYAVDMKNKLETDMNKGYNAILKETFKKRIELVLPALILLDLYKIFRCCLKIKSNLSDVKTLDTIISSLEKSAGIKSVGPFAQSNNAFETIYNALPGMLGGLMGANADTSQLPPFEKVKENFNNVLESGTLKNFVTKLGENFQSGGVEKTLSYVLGELRQDSELISEVKKVMPDIVNMMPPMTEESNNTIDMLKQALPGITENLTNQIKNVQQVQPVAEQPVTSEINLLDI